MDLNYSAADNAFRQEVRSWLEANLPAEISEKVLNHRRANRDDLVRWHKILAGKGWSVPHWPVEFGGTGWNATQRHIWDEENARVGAPGVLPFGVAMVAPVIMSTAMPSRSRTTCRVSSIAPTGGARAIRSRVRVPTSRR